MEKRIICSLFFLGLAWSLCGQVMIQFEPVINGQTIDGLAYVRLVNSSPNTIEGSLKITVKDLAGRSAVQMLTPAFSLAPGNNVLNRTVFARSSITFGNTPAGNALSQTSRFMEGEYEYCYEFISDPKAINPQTYFNCFQHLLQPSTPLSLIEPFNRSSICNTRPDLMWIPPVPLQPEVRFRVLLVEIKEKQLPAEALSMNLPLILTGNLSNNILNFPSQAPSLIEGKTYAWQVLAYAGKTTVTQSEIWSFTIKCGERKTDSTRNSYAELKVELDGNYYVADRILRFSFDNPYGDGMLSYDIRDVSKPDKSIKKLPPIKMKAGLNVIDLDLSTHPAFKNGGQYILTVSNIEQHKLQMRFLYKK
jgi:hypothetical protein